MTPGMFPDYRKALRALGIVIFLAIFFWGPLIWLAARAIDRGF